MRSIAICLLATLTASGAVAQDGRAGLDPLAIEPAIEERLRPAIRPDLTEFAETGIGEAALSGALIAAIVGEDGLERERFVMAETFDDAPLDPDDALVQAELDDM